MTLPRYLERKFSVYLSTMTQRERLVDVICAGADYGPLVFDVLKMKRSMKKAPSYDHIISSFVRARWAYFELRCHRRNEIDGMERVSGKLYVGLAKSPSGYHFPELRQVILPKYFEARLAQVNSAREEKDRVDAELVQKIAAVRNKVYASRCFPTRLRLIIFERDQYRCQSCLRDKDALFTLGLRLEVDHIVAYVDGGETRYNNGITLCNECNCAKHHTKDYFRAIKTLS